MSSFAIGGYETLLDRPHVNPTMAWGFTLLSLLTAFLYTLFLDFEGSYIKPPKHFLPRGWFVNFGKPNVKAPLVELNQEGDYREALERGSRMYPDKPYRIPHHPNEWVIIPSNMIEQFKNLPEHKLSFQQGSYDLLLGWHTGITNHERVVPNILKGGANKIIDAVYSAVQDESLRTVQGNIGTCEDWTEVALLPKSVNMIMAISQRIFVGEPLCRSQEWLQCIMKVTQNAFGSVPSLWTHNTYTLPLVAWRHPGLRSARASRQRAKGLLKPVLEKRLAELKSPNFKSPPDLMQFVLDATAATGEGRSLDYQVNAIIGTGRAALFTTAITIFHIMYDLAIHPEHIEPIRQELKELGDVPMSRPNVAKLIKLDSFIRESQRFSMFSLLGTLRKVMAAFTLPDGTELPAGTYIATNVRDAMFRCSSLDNPAVFDGFRFERLRQLEGNAQKYQSVQTASDHLVYGIGSQACPGRFLAAHEARVVLSHILLNYDFKLKEPYPKRHPMDTASGVMTTPDTNVTFLFKRRDPNA